MHSFYFILIIRKKTSRNNHLSNQSKKVTNSVTSNQFTQKQPRYSIRNTLGLSATISFPPPPLPEPFFYYHFHCCLIVRNRGSDPFERIPPSPTFVLTPGRTSLCGRVDVTSGTTLPPIRGKHVIGVVGHVTIVNDVLIWISFFLWGWDCIFLFYQFVGSNKFQYFFSPLQKFEIIYCCLSDGNPFNYLFCLGKKL